MATFIKIYLIVFLLSGCGFTVITKKAVNEACAHSETHKDIVFLVANEELFQPHAVIVACNCQYGFDCSKLSKTTEKK